MHFQSYLVIDFNRDLRGSPVQKEQLLFFITYLITLHYLNEMVNILLLSDSFSMLGILCLINLHKGGGMKIIYIYKDYTLFLNLFLESHIFRLITT